jgi:HEAT repeat protein
MASVPRRRVLPWLGVLALPWRVDGADAVGRLIETLGSARNFKLRAHAATLLARLKDQRSLPALMKAAAADPHPAVRAVAVRLCGRMARGDVAAAQKVRPAIARGLGDRDPAVRRQATAALADLERSFPSSVAARPPARSATTLVAVGTVGDRTGRAPRAVRERMRALMVSFLEHEPRIQVAAMTAPGVAFLIDGTIARLQVGQSGAALEALCAVELVVSRPPRGIVTVASGEATVQRPRAQFHPVAAERLQEDALENAVRSAHESLAQFLRAQ